MTYEYQSIPDPQDADLHALVLDAWEAEGWELWQVDENNGQLVLRRKVTT